MTPATRKLWELLAAGAAVAGVTVGVAIWLDDQFHSHADGLSRMEGRLNEKMELNQAVLLATLDDSEELLISRTLNVGAEASSERNAIKSAVIDMNFRLGEMLAECRQSRSDEE